MTDRPIVPIDCPRCGRQLIVARALAPEPRWRWHAILLLLLGVTASGTAVLLSLPVVSAVIAYLSVPDGGRLGRPEREGLGLLGFLLWPVVIVVSLLPALVLGRLASRMAKVLKIRCRGCGWSGSYVLPTAPPRSFPVDDGEEEPEADGSIQAEPPPIPVSPEGPAPDAFEAPDVSLISPAPALPLRGVGSEGWEQRQGRSERRAKSARLATAEPDPEFALEGLPSQAELVARHANRQDRGWWVVPLIVLSVSMPVVALVLWCFWAAMVALLFRAVGWPGGEGP